MKTVDNRLCVIEEFFWKLKIWIVHIRNNIDNIGSFASWYMQEVVFKCILISVWKDINNIAGSKVAKYDAIPGIITDVKKYFVNA